MAIDLSKAPYFDDYDPNKNYTKIVGMPGRVSQVREFTQAQDIQQEFLKRLGNTVHRNGDIIDGCDIIIDTGKAVISEGHVFIDGLIHNVHPQTVPITGRGNEYIGITLVESIITEKEDLSLYDNAEGYRNYGNSGAHRIQSVPKWVTSGDMIPIFEIVDGQLSNSSNTTDDSDTMSRIVDMMARRTFDENGSYKVNGLRMIDRKMSDADRVFVQVQEGKAYIAGYEVNKEASSLVDLDKSVDTRCQYNETFTYTPDITYPMNNSPVKQIDDMDCLVQKTADMTRGDISGGFDIINDEREGSVVEIVKVSAGDTEYHAVQDYVFKEGGISWEPTGGTEPETGTSYQVTYRFLQRMNESEYQITHNKIYQSPATYTMTRSLGETDDIPVPAGAKIVDIKRVYKEGTEYQVSTDWSMTGNPGSYKLDWSLNNSKPDGDYNIDLVVLLSTYDSTNDYIEFKELETPIISGSQFTVDYTFYLARVDLVLMNTNQVCTTIRGVPDTLYKVFAPTNNDDRLLPLGTVLIYPNSDQIAITNFDNYRLSQSQLYNVRKRVDNLEYDIAMSDLDKEAMEGENATLLKGIFTDGFIGPTKADVSHTDFDCSFDFDYGFLMLPQNETVMGLRYDTNKSTAIVQHGVASAPYTNELMIYQKAATTEFPVNPYSVYRNLAILEADPYVDNWVDSSKLTVDAGTAYDQRYESVSGGTRYVNGGTTRKTVVRGGIFKDYDQVSTSSSTSHRTVTSNRTEESYRTQTDIILDEAIEYMRPITINLRGSNYTINADNLTCYFNDQKIDMTPTGQSVQGSTEGTMKSDSDGKFEATITVPEGIPCGTVDILVTNENNNGGTRFSAQGRRQIIQESVFRTVTTVTTRTTYTTVTRYTTITTIHDPLAQSFYVENDCVMTQLGLFFSKKDKIKNIIIEIRELNDGGDPSATILHQQVVYAKDILIDDKGLKETLITLDQPLYLQGGKSYCFVIVSDSNEYVMWTAQLGGIDENSFNERYQVVSNPYVEGVMFSSSNAQSWTIHQDQDLKFNIYRARYSGSGTITYPDTTMNEANALLLAAQTVDYANQGVNWTFSEPNDTDLVTWEPIKELDYLELDKLMNKISLKCELVTYDDRMSPFLNVDSVNLAYYNNEESGAYVSRQVVMEQSFNTLQVSIEAYTPEGTSFKIYYNTENDNTSWNEMTNPVTTQVDQFFTRYTYTKDSLPANTNKCRIKIEMSTTDKLYTPVLRRLISIMKNV